jgi:hypothetical protein
MKEKPTAKDIGMIGSNKVVQYGDAPMLIIGKTWLSAGKIKAVLANLDACRQFLIKHDAPEPAKPAVNPNVEAEKAKLLERIKELEAKANAAAVSQNGHNRLDPIKAA